jgi:hypothetical protein
MVEAEAVPINTEDVVLDPAYWRRLDEEHGFPLIVTGSVKLLVAPAMLV